MSDRFVSVTIPYGRGYEEPKITFHGSAEEVATDLRAAFGIDGTGGQTLHELVSDASNIALALGVIREEFPGTQSVRGSKRKKELTPDELLIERIKAETSVEQLQILFAEEEAEGRSIKDRPEVWAAWNQRGLELTSGK